MENATKPTNRLTPVPIGAENLHTRIAQQIVVTRSETPQIGVPRIRSKVVKLRAKNLRLRDVRKQLTALQRIARSTNRAKMPRVPCRYISTRPIRRTTGKRPGLPPSYQLPSPWPLTDEMWLELQAVLRTSMRDLFWELRGKVLAWGEKFGLDELRLVELGIIRPFDRATNDPTSETNAELTTSNKRLYSQWLDVLCYDLREQKLRFAEAKAKFDADPEAQRTAARLQRLEKLDREYAIQNTRGFFRQNRWQGNRCAT